MITERDKQILGHVCNYGFITIEQAHKMIYPNIKRGYEYARQRIQYLCKIEKKLKPIHDTATKTKMFLDISDNKRNISLHRIYTMNLYCNLVGIGADIEEYEIEKEWSDGKVRSDAFCVFTFGGYRFRLLVETNTSNNKINLEKYDSVKDEILSACGNKLPRIVLIDDRDSKSYSTKVYQVVRLDYNMSNMQNLFI
jgi:hypothetical protein